MSRVLILEAEFTVKAVYQSEVRRSSAVFPGVSSVEETSNVVIELKNAETGEYREFLSGFLPDDESILVVLGSSVELGLAHALVRKRSSIQRIKDKAERLAGLKVLPVAKPVLVSLPN